MRSGRGSLIGGSLVLAGIASACLSAPLWGDPIAIDLNRARLSPGAGSWLGTDALGRDLLARLVHGGRESLTAGLVATVLSCLLGFGFGALAGTTGPWGDRLLSRTADMFNAFPALVGALALLSVPGLLVDRFPTDIAVGLIVGLFTWPLLFRFVRGEIRRWTSSDVTAAAHAVGASPLRVTFRHLIPLAIVPAIVPATFVAAAALLAEAALGFLGLGIGPPEPSWGNLLRDARSNPSLWWLSVFPGLALFATVLGLHLVSEGLRSRVTAGSGPGGA